MIYSGTHTVSATVKNTFGVAQVSMFVDGVLVDTRAGSVPETSVWSFPLDTTKFSGTLAMPVTHTITFVAYDKGGNSSNSSLTIQIGN